MTNKCFTLRAAFIIVLLSACVPSATATSFDFFEASSAKGSSNWFAPDNLNAYNAWRAAIGEVPDFGEDWDGTDWLGNPWVDNRLFDVQDIATAIFVDGVTFSNVGSDANRHAAADDAPGSTDAIDRFAWRGDVSGLSTIFFPNHVDYLGFYTFDTDNPVDYFVQFSNGDIESIGGKETDEDRYRFVGFVNRHPTAQIAAFWVAADNASRYGIDELQWGRTPPPGAPEPATVWMFTAGVGLLLYRKRRQHR